RSSRSGMFRMNTEHEGRCRRPSSWDSICSRSPDSCRSVSLPTVDAQISDRPYMFSRRTGWKLAPNRLSQAQEEVRSAGTEVVDLTLSNPTAAGLTYDSEAILNALMRPEALDYDPQPKGLLTARKAVVDYYREQHEGFDLDPESLLLATSTSEAYSFVFRLL